MIGLLIFGFFLVCAFYAWFPNYLWLIEPVFVGIAVLWLIIKGIIAKIGSNNKGYDDEWDDAVHWVDDQGLF